MKALRIEIDHREIHFCSVRCANDCDWREADGEWERACGQICCGCGREISWRMAVRDYAWGVFALALGLATYCLVMIASGKWVR
jgi:hypothetical protein